MDVRAWLLTNQETGEPAHPDRRRPRRRNRLEPRQLRTGHRPRAALLRGAPRAHPRPGPRGPPLLRRLARRPGPAAHRRPWVDPQRHTGRRGQARCRCSRAAVAVPLAPPRLQCPPASLPGRGDRRGRRAVPAGHAGADPRRPPPEVRGHPVRRGPDPRHRLPRRHRPVPRPARRPHPPRRPSTGGARQGLRPDPAVARRPGGDPGPGGPRRGDDVPRTLGGQHPAHPQPGAAGLELGAPRGPLPGAAGRPSTASAAAARRARRRPDHPDLPGHPAQGFRLRTRR